MKTLPANKTVNRVAWHCAAAFWAYKLCHGGIVVCFFGKLGLKLCHFLDKLCHGGRLIDPVLALAHNKLAYLISPLTDIALNRNFFDLLFALVVYFGSYVSNRLCGFLYAV